ncbi:MAG: 3-hydroxyacyl-CoA dehydrogenase/enoyl-CoA hydratase family protein [Candidatus Krumholzibacteria bacterium]|nr:3-hydroxyacyl-CoA dehydrogenase/enoyl-CoA hydratase family protein [Candidatus Krumholzibacteria bacterium]
MQYSIDRAAVIGAGVMGATLAAHLANAGIPTLLLDIVPPPNSKIEGDPKSRHYRDAFARAGIDRALKAKPAAFYAQDSARLITPGNMEDDLDKLKDVDWVLEAVPEKLNIKEAVFTKLAPRLKDTAILTTNTSGLSVNDMGKVISKPLRKRFLVTHFFNPPRYMRLLEIVPHAETDPGVTEYMKEFGEDRLGKGVVVAKDTPNFIANRIGAFSIAATLRAMAGDGFTIEEVDVLTGPIIGRPKSASLRTADLVGIDTLAHTAKTVFDGATADERREYFQLPNFVEEMIKKGLLGEKTGEGFYKKVKKDGQSEILSLDYSTFEYRARKRASFPSLELVRGIDDPGERIAALLKGKDRAAQFLWSTISETLLYSVNRLGEIADNIVDIDNAMKWGFNWEVGPFELWDVLGVEKVVERLKKDKQPIPDVLEDVLRSESKQFYRRDKDLTHRYFVPGGEYEVMPERKSTISLQRLKSKNKVIKKNAGASLIDMGDGVLGLEFHSKMNAIGGDIIQMINFAVKETEANQAALVVGNQASNFSVGANLMLLLLEAQDANWEEIDLIVRAFQNANMAMKYCKRPVVAAPFGMTLGGGCEVCLGAGHVFASAETYIGLVELGVGLIPAGGGCKELLLRQLEGRPLVEDLELFPFVRAAFETIGLAKVATSAEEARQLRFLRISDGVAMNPERLIYQAKAMALGLYSQGYRPPDPTIEIPVVGESGLGAIKTHLYLLKEANYISEYDQHLGGQLATILCGGRVLRGTMVSEQHLLDLEREVFLGLCGQRKTLERMQYMLKKGKPLRN